ncbi:MAG: ACT domain-containing protein [Chloroflexi bacterium]|nr:MAG: ACT domain-containing protein [Chloroflexota bacterium]
MEQTKEFSLTLDDRPGTLAKATDAIAKAGINIEGYCAVPSGNSGKGTFRVVTKDPANTRKALEAAGFKVQDERDAAIIDVEDRPGTVAQIFRKLAENELNVGPTYSITQNRIVISADDFSKLRDTLQELTPARRR